MARVVGSGAVELLNFAIGSGQPVARLRYLLLEVTKFRVDRLHNDPFSRLGKSDMPVARAGIITSVG